MLQRTPGAFLVSSKLRGPAPLNTALCRMSADQVAEIAPLVREVLAAASSGAAADTELCATFQVVDNSSAWAQVTAGHLNVAYPFEDAPMKRLDGVFSQLSDVVLVAWQPGNFATIAFGPASALSIAKVVDATLSRLFAVEDYSINGMLERL